MALLMQSKPTYPQMEQTEVQEISFVKENGYVFVEELVYLV